MSYTLNEFRARITAEKEFSTYEKLEDVYGVNRWYLWHVINTDDYKPPLKIAVRLGIVIPAQVVSINGNIPDGSLALTAVICPCGQPFISNHPRRRKCFLCSPYKGRKP